MFQGYHELEKLDAMEYLNWQQFATPFDSLPSHVADKTAERQYQAGLDIGHNATEIHLSYRGVWSSRNKSGSSTGSYEGIGYHAWTCELLHGFLDSGTPIIVHRYNDGKIVSTQIN